MKLLEVLLKQYISVYIGGFFLFMFYKFKGENKSFQNIVNSKLSEDSYERIKAFYIGVLVLILIVLSLKYFMK